MKKFLVTLLMLMMIMTLFIPFKSHADQMDSDCFNKELPITDEELRIDDPDNNTPQRILEDSGFDIYVDEFQEALCEANDLETTKSMVEEKGSQLWRNAIERAQNKNTEGLDRYDDRPLYWVRQHMTMFIRQWDPEFSLSENDRMELLKEIEYSSRGINSIQFSDDDDVKRILVSGFDPY